MHDKRTPEDVCGEARFSSIKKRIQIPHLEIYAKKLQLGSKMLKEIMKMLTCKLSYFNSTAHFVVEVCRVVNDINIWVPYPCLKPKISIPLIILMTFTTHQETKGIFLFKDLLRCIPFSESEN